MNKIITKIYEFFRRITMSIFGYKIVEEISKKFTPTIYELYHYLVNYFLRTTIQYSKKFRDLKNMLESMSVQITTENLLLKKNITETLNEYHTDVLNLNKNKDIIEELKHDAQGLRNWRTYSRDHFLHHLVTHPEIFEQFYNMLEDDQSRATFDWLVGYRIGILQFGEQEFWKTEKTSALYKIFNNGFTPEEIQNTFQKASTLRNSFDMHSEIYTIWHTFILKHYELSQIYEHKPGDIIFDLGGACGDTALFFSRLTGNTGKVYVFEPGTWYRQKINENLSYFSIQNVIIVPFGCFSEQKTLFYNQNFICDQHTNGSEEVKCITLDSFVIENNIKKVDFIKLDIEGGETEALKGSIKTIKNMRPSIALSIYHNGSNGYEDFYTLPSLIKDLCKNYNFYLRHDNACIYETILFCIPIEKLYRMDHKK